MSKDEILDQYMDDDRTMFTIFKAMDEYAKQEAIEFAEFIGRVKTGKTKVQLSQLTTFAELYDIYIQSKNNQ